MFQVIPKKIIRQGASHAVSTPVHLKQSQKQIKVVSGAQAWQQPQVAAGNVASNQQKHPNAARSSGPASQGSNIVSGQPSKLALRKGPTAQVSKKHQGQMDINGQQQHNAQHVYESSSQIGSARFQNAGNAAAYQHQKAPRHHQHGKKASNSMINEMSGATQA